MVLRAGTPEYGEISEPLPSKSFCRPSDGMIKRGKEGVGQAAKDLGSSSMMLLKEYKII